MLKLTAIIAVGVWCCSCTHTQVGTTAGLIAGVVVGNHFGDSTGAIVGAAIGGAGGNAAGNYADTGQVKLSVNGLMPANVAPARARVITDSELHTKLTIKSTYVRWYNSLTKNEQSEVYNDLDALWKVWSSRASRARTGEERAEAIHAMFLIEEQHKARERQRARSSR